MDGLCLLAVLEPKGSTALGIYRFLLSARTAKPRVVYDGAATVGGASLNRAVLAGENLLNSLVGVLCVSGWTDMFALLT